MQKTITPIDNTVYVEREYQSSKIEETIDNSMKAQKEWAELNVNERVKLLKNFVKDNPQLVPYRTEWMVYHEEMKDIKIFSLENYICRLAVKSNFAITHIKEDSDGDVEAKFFYLYKPDK